MKEFQTKDGGRKIYNEDFLYLQELVDSLSQFFVDCNLDFVLSGCQPDKELNVEGYVFLDGKIRKLEKTSIYGMISPAIVINDTEINDYIEDTGQLSAAYINYGCKVIDSASVYWSGKSIKYSNNSVPTMVESFLDYYMILREHDEQQIVFSDLTANKVTLKLPKFGSDSSYPNITMTNNNENETITINLSSTESVNIEITDNGDITFTKKNNGTDSTPLVLGNNADGGDTLNFDSLTMQELVTKDITIESGTIRDVDLDTIFNLLGTDWLPIINAKTGETWDRCRVCMLYGVVYIQGELPQDFLDDIEFVKDQSTTAGYYYTKYKLPDSIPYLSTKFFYSMQLFSWDHINYSVFIDNEENEYKRRFFLYNQENASGYFKTSNYINSPTTTYPYVPVSLSNDKIRQHVSWQFIPNSAHQTSYNKTTKYEFYCTSVTTYRISEYTDTYFSAWVKITDIYTNSKTGQTVSAFRWEEAEFAGAIFNDSTSTPPNFDININDINTSVKKYDRKVELGYYISYNYTYNIYTNKKGNTLYFKKNDGSGYWNQQSLDDGYYNGKPGYNTKNYKIVYNGYSNSEKPPITIEL